MTDFVDRLLGRSGLAPIRPLLPTLFEPATRGDVDEPLPMGVFTNSPAAGAPAEPGAHQDWVSPEQAPLPASTPMSSSAPLRPPLAAVNRVETAPVTDHPQVVRATSHREQAHPSQPAAIAAHQRAVTVHPDRPPPPAVLSTPPTPSTGWPDHPVVQQSPAVNRRHTTGHPRSLPQPVARSSQQDREPDVHISIGRVEIKATPPAAAPPRRQDTRRRPQLTLDDYLRSRES
jgi:hypothetical protein